VAIPNPGRRDGGAPRNIQSFSCTTRYATAREVLLSKFKYRINGGMIR
jgi:hypothetical protein